jgi:hypothetical protein
VPVRGAPPCDVRPTWCGRDEKMVAGVVARSPRLEAGVDKTNHTQELGFFYWAGLKYMFIMMGLYVYRVPGTTRG